jgi:hypothetical protein
MSNSIKKEHVNESLTEICKTVNVLEQKVYVLRDYLNFGITGKRGLRGLPIPERGISYTKEIIGYILEQLDESEKYMMLEEYKHRLK